MPRIISPPRDQLHLLRSPLTRGEAEVLEFFDETLPADWEIYIQPHLNGARPDFVLLNPNVGIAVFEVKDWDLDAMPYWVDQEEGPVLRAQAAAGPPFTVKDNPVEKVVNYKSEILSLYCPRLGLRVEEFPGAVAVVTAGVIMMGTSTRRARELFAPFVQHLNLGGTKAPYHTIVGADAIRAGALNAVLPSALHERSFHMKSEFADDLRGWLVEPELVAEQRTVLPLTSVQRRIATTRNPNGYRRIRGPAGSGKSLALAARAAELAAQKKEVLVVSFNITLLHCLRDFAVRHPHPRGCVAEQVTWLHFHEWCHRVCSQAGYSAEYAALFDGLDVAPRERLHEVLEFELPALVGQSLDANPNAVSNFDAILVDEGQDFNLTWWNLLRRVLRHDGEMLLAADTTQDMYGRARHWTEDSMVNAGFRGPWGELKQSFRFPDALVPHLQQYATRYLPPESTSIPHAAQLDFLDKLEPVDLRWVQTSDERSLDHCVLAMRHLATAPAPVAWADIVVLLETHTLGLACVERLEGMGVSPIHVFGQTSALQKKLKKAFWMGRESVKAATIHSFKGWEARALVVQIGRAQTAEELGAVYVALSRLRRSQQGSFLTVVCSAPELESYGKTWPTFECA